MLAVAYVMTFLLVLVMHFVDEFVSSLSVMSRLNNVLVAALWSSTRPRPISNNQLN